ncbi:CBS domain-containing protein [Sphingobacterium rhinopitheci]|uniref:hypothetical protein n=1 Tax=Sphingobacterium rhinopitheci TaxID=2781960 RepID=UPI001F52602E|nr:hypothetical protein [Sphingobacterium rhinopitheci]MCI0922525.1 hypothetical protein [Sphingobacterium rhinopitheci]
MSNAEKFLEIYNRIDIYLKDRSKSDYETFATKVKNSNNVLIKRYQIELLDYGELRNAIVHNPKIGGKYIAEPLAKVIENFESILNKLESPLKVIPEFQFEVLGAKEDDDLLPILKTMRENSFSQFPIFNEQGVVIELINTNTISRWLANQTEDNDIVIENPKVLDLIIEVEFKQNYRFISRSTNIYEAYNLFIQQIIKKKRNLDVLFITHSGCKSEKLLGLITIEDIANLV